MKKTNNRLKKLKDWFKKVISYEYLIEEMALIIGFFIIIFTTFLLNFYVGMYILGLFLVSYSVFSYKNKG